MLSLLSMVAIGFLAVSKTETEISAALDAGYRARLAAYSGKEITLLKLKTDPLYSGESGMAFPDSAGYADLAVASPRTFERDIESTGYCGAAKSVISVSSTIYPHHFEYAQVVCGDFVLEGYSKILGDLYVTGNIQGDQTAMITGDVHLYGDRAILTDVYGKVVSIDGYTVPEIGGDVLDCQKVLEPADWSLSSLKALALKQGQVYTTNQVFKNRDLTGVVYLESGVDAVFQDVTIRGVLVMEAPSGFDQLIYGQDDAISKASIESGCYLKIISDAAVQQDLAVVAPASELEILSTAFLDVKGTLVAGYVDLRTGGDAVVTGTTIVHGLFKGYGEFTGQSPYETRDTDPPAVLFDDYTVKETEYAEQ